MTNCPSCHSEVRPTDYFCFNCGRNLIKKPLSTSVGTQLWLYFKSALLPPLGLIWGFRYFRQPDKYSKITGTIAILITLASLVYTIRLFQSWGQTYSDLNEQYSTQIRTLMQ